MITAPPDTGVMNHNLPAQTSTTRTLSARTRSARTRSTRKWIAGVFVGLCILPAIGCSSFRLPALGTIMANPTETTPPPSEFVGSEGMPVAAPGSVAEQIYHATRQARSQSGIVLHVVGDSTPIRVLPIPEGGQSVYVSQLLTQTGVVEKLGSVEATLFRHSAHAIGGLPMECKMSKDRRQIRPESDYALQAGDRLRVNKASSFAASDLLDMALGR